MSLANSNTPIFPTSAIAVTKSDTAAFSPSAIYVGTAGDVAVMPADPSGATAVTFKNVPSGSVLPIMCIQVMSTNTTGSDFVRLS